MGAAALRRGFISNIASANHASRWIERGHGRCGYKLRDVRVDEGAEVFPAGVDARCEIEVAARVAGVFVEGLCIIRASPEGTRGGQERRKCSSCKRKRKRRARATRPIKFHQNNSIFIAPGFNRAYQ